MSKLKPCPFCGIKPELVSLVTPVRYFYHCPNCGVGNELQGFDSDEAQRFWNTRPIEDELRAELDKRTAGLHYANAVCMEMKHELDRLKEENHALDQINRDIQTAAAHLDEVLAELTRKDEIIAKLKEDAEILCDIADNFGDDAVAVLKHRALMKELE